MNTIDHYAYISPLRRVHPGEKALLALLTIVMVLALDSLLVSGMVFFIISLLLLFPGRVAFRVYRGLLLVPLLFLLVGCAAIAVAIQTEYESLLATVKVGPYWIGVSSNSLLAGAALFWRCLACVACMYFLALTTPVTQMVYILRRVKLPSTLIDVMSLIYIAIFDFLATAVEIRVAQQSRCGYDRFSAGMRSLSTLSYQMFVKFLHKSDQSYDALLARGFAGSLLVLEESFVWKRRNVMAIVAFNLLLVMFKNYGVVW